MIEAAIFDLDGVLLDTEWCSRKAARMVAESHGFIWKHSDTKMTQGGSASRYAEHLIAMGVPGTVDEIVERWRVAVETVLQRDEIELLSSRDVAIGFRDIGLPIAIASNSTRRYYKLKIWGKEAHTFDHFDAVILADDPRGPGPKPAPDLFLLAAKDLGVAPEKCLVFEDSDVGVQAAIAAGMQVVRVRS